VETNFAGLWMFLFKRYVIVIMQKGEKIIVVRLGQGKNKGQVDLI